MEFRVDYEINFSGGMSQGHIRRMILKQNSFIHEKNVGPQMP